MRPDTQRGLVNAIALLLGALAGLVLAVAICGIWGIR